MSDVSRTVVALIISVPARAVPLLALVLLCATSGPVQAQDTDPVQPVDAVCSQAADLNADALPAQAIAVIDAYRESLGDTGAAACQTQYATALQQQYRAKLFVALADGDPEAPGTAVAGCTLGANPAPTTYAAAALTCDRENGDAASLADEPKPAFWAKWNAFYDNSLAPLVDVLVTWLAMLAGLVLLARLLVPAFPKMQPRRGWFAPILVTIGVLMFVFGLFTTNEPSVGLGLVIWFLGVALITGLAAVLAKAVAPRLHGTVSEPTIGMVVGVALAGLGCAFILADARWPVVILWGCVALAGAVVWAFSWSRVLRIHIAVHGADAEEDAAAQGRIIALLQELGGRSPRGLESPRGADTTALANAGLATTPEGRILKAVYNAVQIILPTTPWRVRVDMAGPDRWSVDITRNGRAVKSVVIDRDRLGLRVPVKDAQGEPRKGEDEPVYPSLDRMAAAAVLCTLDAAYGWDSLCGTTSWESLGLHAIATTDFAQTDSDATALLAKALWRDPGNRLAQVALWHHQHRRETKTDRLQEYLDLLDGYVAGQRSRNQALEVADLTGTPAGDAVLLLRVLYTRVAVYINLQASKGRYLPGDEHDRAAELQHCWRGLGEGDPPVAEYRNAHADEQENLLASVFDTPPGSRSWLLPRPAYQRACELVSRRQRSLPLEPDGAWPTTPITLLRRADADEELRDWRDKDPQLQPLRADPEYLKAFGADPKPEDAILSLPLFTPHQDTLSAIGATNARALLRYSGAELAAVLHVGSSTAAEMLEVACLANSVSEQPALRPWSVDITELLLQQGVKDVGQVPREEQVNLARKVHEGLQQRGLKNCPELHVVCGWIAPGLAFPAPA